MPKRTNKFQKLIHLVHMQLTDSRIVESAMFVDQRTGQKREVDIAIISTVANYPMIVSIECRDHSRPQSTGWIEEMWAKHQALPTNALVLVSSSGFYKPAIEAAIKLGVEALSLDEAEDSNWPELCPNIKKFRITEIWSTPIRCTIVPNEKWLPFGMEQQILSKLEVFSHDNQPLGTLNKIFENARCSVKFEPTNEAPTNENVSVEVDGHLKFKRGTYLIDDKNKQRLLKEMHFRVRFEGFISEGESKQFIFRDSLINLAESDGKHAEIIFTTVIGKGEKFKCGASVTKLKNIPDACKWDFAVPEEFMDEGTPVNEALSYRDSTQFKTSGKPCPDAPKFSFECKVHDIEKDNDGKE